MIYERMRRGIFLDRPNRFIARVEMDGAPMLCHVKNTGRCRELLLPGAAVLVQQAAPKASSRKTGYDLIAVWKGRRLVNMDAAAPNQVCGEWLRGGGLGFRPTLVKPECTHEDSRFDFYFEMGESRAFMEVKGVTLEQDGAALFPDAPTLRGVKHLRGLARCVEQGFQAYAVFIIQMQDVDWFGPNWSTHPEFGTALRQAQAAGVRILALDCQVSETSLSVRRPVEVRL